MNTDTVSFPTPEQELQARLARDVDALRQAQPHIRKANVEPLPGPLALAFTAAELKQLGFTIRPVVASDFILLKALNSPLYRQTFAMAEHVRQIAAKEIPSDSKLPVTTYTDDECIEMVYQFTRPIQVVRQEFQKGRAAFREAALSSITDQLPIAEWANVPRLVATVIENFTNAFSTAIKHQAVQEEQTKTVFTTPQPETATASAGGLTT